MYFVCWTLTPPAKHGLAGTSNEEIVSANGCHLERVAFSVGFQPSNSPNVQEEAARELQAWTGHTVSFSNPGDTVIQYPEIPRDSMGLPHMPISWGGLRGQWGGIYGSPMGRVWGTDPNVC